MTEMLNLTPTRLRALRIIQQQPGINAQDLAYELVERPWRHPAAATRWGSSYAMPLILSGLISSSPTRPGWKRLTLTTKGRQMVLEGNGDD